MKTRVLLFALEFYRAALPGYHYEFPRDHFNHPEFQTEWWYYTGNLRDTQGRRFGFELTFFRQGVDRGKEPGAMWDVRDVWLAHLALSDIDGGKFLHTERLNRSGPGLAGSSLAQARVNHFGVVISKFALRNSLWHKASVADSATCGYVSSRLVKRTTSRAVTKQKRTFLKSTD